MTESPVFTIGIGGGTGAGKSFLADQLQKQLNLPTYHLCTDRYLRDWDDLPQTATGLKEMDLPTSFFIDELIEHIDALRNGEPTYLPIYDWQTHQRSPMAEGVEPPVVLIVDGIIALVDEKLRSRFDLKLAVETDSRVRMVRRIETDLNERHLNMEAIKTRLLSSVIPADLAIILPANDFADIKIDGQADFQNIIAHIKGHLAARFSGKTHQEGKLF